MLRTVTPELLDNDTGTPREIADSLADLRFFNRAFGGIDTTEQLVRRVVRESRARELSLLEVAAGSGDVPLTVQRRLAPDVRLRVTLLDSNASHLPANAPTVVANALALPFADDSFDIVSCALFVHHLEPDEVPLFASEALRVARRAVLINDLRRGTLHLALIYAGMPLYRSRLTRHDAVASVRRAYTECEMRSMLEPLGQRINITRHYLLRMGVILWK